MRQFEIIVAPETRSGAKTLHFAVLECDLILVGESASLVSDYCSCHQISEEGQKIITLGSCKDGKLIFEDGVLDTLDWQRDEVRDFLAGAALPLSAEKAESRSRNANEMESFLKSMAQDPHTTVVRF